MMEPIDSDWPDAVIWEPSHCWFWTASPNIVLDEIVLDEDAELAEASARALRRATLEDD